MKDKCKDCYFLVGANYQYECHKKPPTPLVITSVARYPILETGAIGCGEFKPEERANALARADAAEAEVERLTKEIEELRGTIKAVAQEALNHWDAGTDSKVGKVLNSLAGNLIGHYRADVDKVMGYETTRQ